RRGGLGGCPPTAGRARDDVLRRASVRRRGASNGRGAHGDDGLGRRGRSALGDRGPQQRRERIGGDDLVRDGTVSARGGTRGDDRDAAVRRTAAQRERGEVRVGGDDDELVVVGLS